MVKTIRLFVLALSFLPMALLAQAKDPEAQAHAAWIRAHYTKFEYRIPMRDGVKLFTNVYVPNWTQDNYPIILFRTPYSVGPYGTDKYKEYLGPDPALDKDGYIFVYQDVRGRFMSEGFFMDMTPHATLAGGKKAVTNESTDTYDTIDWLVKNLPRNNGNVGQWGISYPGFYTAAGMISSHPALKIASPQAPIADWYWDDMHHNGAFSLNLAFNFFSSFGVKRDGLTDKWPKSFEHGTPDGYQFFLDMGPLSNANAKYFHGEIQFWNDFIEHPNYDWFWQTRNILPHLKDVTCAVLTVGGWFDAEDLYGPLTIYRSVEEKNPGITNTMVMGPWSHGGWARTKGDRLGDARFGFPSSDYYNKLVLVPAFQHYLKGGPKPNLPEALVFETGANRWHHLDAWPPKAAQDRTLYLNPGNNVAFEPKAGSEFDAFISDPRFPVPSTVDVTTSWGRDFMTQDQRYATRRPDVLTFTTDVLTEDLVLAGPIDAELWVSTDQGDADWVVKIIDVYPPDEPAIEEKGEEIPRGNAQILVRYEIIRGRYRDSFEKPAPFEAGKPTKVPLRLMDVFHNFQKGHRMMVQVQSSFFPFFDRNPQKWVPNIFNAKEEDFVSATHKVYHSKAHPSKLNVKVLKH